jgi:hypothetical protein
MTHRKTLTAAEAIRIVKKRRDSARRYYSRLRQAARRGECQDRPETIHPGKSPHPPPCQAEELWLVLVGVLDEKSGRVHSVAVIVGPCSADEVFRLREAINHDDGDQCIDERLLLKVLDSVDCLTWGGFDISTALADENSQHPLSDNGLRPGYVDVFSLFSLRDGYQTDIPSPVAMLPDVAETSNSQSTSQS